MTGLCHCLCQPCYHTWLLAHLALRSSWSLLLPDIGMVSRTKRQLACLCTRARSDYINIFILGREMQDCHFYFRNIWLKSCWKSKDIFSFEINVPSQLLKLWTKKNCFGQEFFRGQKALCYDKLTNSIHCMLNSRVWNGGDYSETWWQKKGKNWDTAPGQICCGCGKGECNIKAVKHLVHLCHIHFYGGIPPTAEYAAPKSSNAFHSTCA